MNAVYKGVEELVLVELESANSQYPPFSSSHEGYAVLLEELDEAESDLYAAKSCIDELWFGIKRNEDCAETVEELRKAAISLACEAIQVAAMAEKYKSL